jgi:hypothetical protein
MLPGLKLQTGFAAISDFTSILDLASSLPAITGAVLRIGGFNRRLRIDHHGNKRVRIPHLGLWLKARTQAQLEGGLREYASILPLPESGFMPQVH